jgi:hypothetical protein
MKFLLYLLLIFSNVYAGTSVQLGAGSLTPHFSQTKKNYCNQWNNTGIIVNKTYYIRVMADNIGFTYLKGNDSICSPIEGIFLHYIMGGTKWIEYGITFGGYSFEMSNWEEHAEDTPKDIEAPGPVWTKVSDRYIVPVLGLDISVHLIKKDRWSLKLNNLLTPFIFNHSLAIEYRF